MLVAAICRCLRAELDVTSIVRVETRPSKHGQFIAISPQVGTPLPRFVSPAVVLSCLPRRQFAPHLFFFQMEHVLESYSESLQRFNRPSPT